MTMLLLLILKIALAIFMAAKLVFVGLAGVFCGVLVRLVPKAWLRQRHGAAQRLPTPKQAPSAPPSARADEVKDELLVIGKRPVARLMR